MADETKPLITDEPSKKKRYIGIAVVVVVVLGVILAAVLLSRKKDEPLPCRHSVVGAGWGGVYYAWRLSVAATGEKIDPKDICIFEASSVRVGGRIFSTEAPESGLIVDLGGYRFQYRQEFVSNAVKTLNLSHICYAPSCDEDMWKIVDSKGLPTGYLQAIKAMLAEIRGAGGHEVMMSHELELIEDTGDSDRPFSLAFKNGRVVRTSSVLLNLPRSAVKALRNTTTNIIFHKSAPSSLNALLLPKTPELRTCKQYVYYEDAWWINYLGLAEGSFANSGDLNGRYHDGPLECNASLCRGALLTSYDVGPFCGRFASLLPTNASDVQWVILRGGTQEQALLSTHRSLMNLHAQAFADRGFDPSNISLPRSTIFSVWDGSFRPIYPGFTYHDDGATVDQNRAMYPIVGSKLFVANVDFGPEDGWAEGSLVLVERILNRYWGAKKPAGVSDAYWNTKVLLPSCNTSSDCPIETCQTSECIEGRCIADYAEVGTPCNVSDPCVAEARCGEQATCLVTKDVYCPEGDICYEGVCEPFIWPACNYSSGELHLKWEFSGTDEIRLAYSLPISGDGWAAFGIGSSMFGADMFVAIIQAGHLSLTDRFSLGFSQPMEDTEGWGGRNDLKNAQLFNLEGRSYIYFNRKLVTGDTYDLPFVNGSQNFLYAWGSGSFSYHGSNAGKVEGLDISLCR